MSAWFIKKSTFLLLFYPDLYKVYNKIVIWENRLAAGGPVY